MALPKRIVKETERLMAEPYVLSSAAKEHPANIVSFTLL